MGGFHYFHVKNAKYVELVFKELNHLAAILHVFAGGLIFMKYFFIIIIFPKGKGNAFTFLIIFIAKSLLL